MEPLGTRSGRYLSCKEYDAAEHRGCAALSIPHLMAFRPVTFQVVGWPTRVDSDAELLRYVDHNFETEVPALFRPGAEFAPAAYRNAFTPDEQKLIASIREGVGSLTEATLGRRIVPVTNLLVQTGPLRIMQQLAAVTANSKLSVFEVGPGAGYLGALLARLGHRYLSYDVTQSLYLWQSRLLAKIAGPDFVELVSYAGNPQRALERSRIVHLPWWTYVEFLKGSSVRVDVVYSNSNLSEMTNLALRHVLHISRQMLTDSPFGVFCFLSKGMPSQTPHEALDSEFEIFGFHKAMESPFYAYTLKRDQAEAVREIFHSGIGFYNPSNSPDRLEAKDVVPLRREEAPLDVQLTQWLHGWEPPYIN